MPSRSKSGPEPRPNSPSRFAYKADRLQPLRAFCQTTRLGSVRAAEALYLSQPRSPSSFRRWSGTGHKLFERSGGGAPPGRGVYNWRAPGGRDRRLPTAFRNQLGAGRGRLNIAANSSTILYLLPPIVERFAAPWRRAPEPAQYRQRRRHRRCAARGGPGGGLDAGSAGRSGLRRCTGSSSTW